MTDQEQEVFERMKGNLPSDYEKDTPGLLTYDLTKANAIEVTKLHTALGALALKLNVANLKGDELTRECLYRRGIERKEATYANVILKVEGQGTVTEGNLFSTVNKIQFKAIETVVIDGEGEVKAECVEAGTAGMVGANTIIQIPITISGITSVTNLEASYDGFEEESDESLLERYLEDIKEPATSNNIYHFKKWAREISGVGKVKIFPTWNGNNSVKVVIIDDNMLPASTDLISETQEYIDPIDPSKWGKGYGKSAIGSYCTVTSGIEKTCNVAATITYSSNYALEQIQTAIENSIVSFLQEIAFDTYIDYVSYAKIAAIIVSTEGVLDCSNVTLNGSTSNITLTDEEVPVLGSVSL